ncbi:MAG: hypothetical protein WBK26_16840 [Burkholderiaceae bacterium]
MKLGNWTLRGLWCFNLRMKVIPKPPSKLTFRPLRRAGAVALPERVGQGPLWLYRGSEETVAAVAKLVQAVAVEQIKQLSMSRQMLAACREQVTTLVDREVLPDRAGDVLKLCEFVHAQLQSIYEGAKSAKSRASSPKVSVLANEVCSESRRLFDLVEVVRWKALEAQADDDIQQGRTQVFDSVEDMFKVLRTAAA